jgi:hypothetical protein
VRPQLPRSGKCAGFSHDRWQADRPQDGTRPARIPIVRFVIQLVESVRQLLRALATTPSALLVPIPVTSSAERVARFSHRVPRRF